MQTRIKGSRLISAQPLGKYLMLEEFCTCTQTYRKYADQIDPFPKNLNETLPAIEALCRHIIDPVIDGFGRDSPSAAADALRTERLRQRFQLTYGFCSVDLKQWLAKKDLVTGKKHGIATPSLEAAKPPLTLTAHGP